MQILLYILLGIFIGLLLVVLVIRFVLKKIVGKVSEAIKQVAGSMPPPFKLELTPVENPEWLKEEGVKQRLAALQANGFQIVGAYSLDGMFDAYTVGLVQPETNTLGAVHWLKSMACLDLVTHYDDGSSVTYCDKQQGSGLGRPAQHQVIRDANASAEELYQRLLAERRPEGITPATAEDFAPRFIKAYNDGTAWVAERGGYTLEEIAAEAQSGSPDAPMEAIEDTHQTFAANALVNWLSTQPDRPEPWDEKECEIVVVHDDLTMRQVTRLLNEMEEEEDSLQEAEVAKAGATARSAFQTINERLGGRFIKVGEKTTERAANFYVRAPEPDDEEEEAD